MSRLMSVAYTEQAVRERIKRVTRRKGWWLDKNGRQLVHVGDTVTLCRKVMGRKKGEPLVRICDVEIVSLRRESLATLVIPSKRGYAEDEMTREGFPGMDPVHFVARYFIDIQRMQLADEVTRIEWRYLDDDTRRGAA